MSTSWTRRCVLTGLASSVLVFAPLRGHGADAKGDGAEAKDVPSEADAAVSPKELQNKLLKITTLENAFKGALRKANLLQRLIAQEKKKLETETDEARLQEIRGNIGNARKQLHTLTTAMNVVFGVGNRREYVYNEVESTIFLKVGTVEEAFARAVATRDALAGFIIEKRKAAEAEKDEAAKKELEKRITVAVRQYQIVVAALQVIYQVTPKRNYEYNPQNSTLYLKISERELEELRSKARELREASGAGKKAAGTTEQAKPDK